MSCEVAPSPLPLPGPRSVLTSYPRRMPFVSCCPGSQVTFISEDETPLAQTLVGATLGSGDRYRMGLDSPGLLCVLQTSCQPGLPLLRIFESPRPRMKVTWGFPQHPPGPLLFPGSLFPPTPPPPPPRGGGGDRVARAGNEARCPLPPWVELSWGASSTPPPHTPQTRRWAEAGLGKAWRPGRPTFLRGIHERGEALGPIPAAVVAADLDLEGRVGPDAVVAVDEVLGVGAGHPRGLPAAAALPAEGQHVAEAVSVLVLPRHGLRGESVAWARGRGALPCPASRPSPPRPREAAPGFASCSAWSGGERMLPAPSRDREGALSGSCLPAAQGQG